MKSRKLYFMECHVAGRQYHEADEVWEDLHVGTPLLLVRDTDNKYDPEAVAIVYRKTYGDEDEHDDYVLGYIPRDENTPIAALLDMGWSCIFECRLSRIDPQAHYENQLRVSIKIKENAGLSSNV